MESLSHHCHRIVGLNVELNKGVRFIDGINEQSIDELTISTTRFPATHIEIVA